MKTRVEISNNWRAWLHNYAVDHGLATSHEAKIGADLAKEIRWVINQNDSQLKQNMELRLGKYRGIIAGGGSLASFDNIGAVRMALWEWALE